MILEKREFIAKLEAVDSDDVAIEQLLSFLYLNKKPRIENFQTFFNLLKCAIQFDIQALLDHLFTLPEILRMPPDNFEEFPTLTSTVIERKHLSDLASYRNYMHIVIISNTFL